MYKIKEANFSRRQDREEIAKGLRPRKNRYRIDTKE
jgi:hypothetical protein